MRASSRRRSTRSRSRRRPGPSRGRPAGASVYGDLPMATLRGVVGILLGLSRAIDIVAPGPHPERTRTPHARPNSRHLFARHRHRPRHGEHARPRAGSRHRHQRAVGRRHRGPDAARSRRRCRGEADGRPDPGEHHRRATAAGRRHQRLRRHRADDQILRRRGPQPDRVDRASADAHRHPIGRHRGREAGGQGRGTQCRCALGPPHRGTDGRRHRGRPAGQRAVGQPDRRHRWRHDRGRRHQPRRHRRQPIHPDRWRRDGPGHRQLRPPRVQPPAWRADGRGHQGRHRLGLPGGVGLSSGSTSGVATC